MCMACVVRTYACGNQASAGATTCGRYLCVPGNPPATLGRGRHVTSGMHRWHYYRLCGVPCGSSASSTEPRQQWPASTGALHYSDCLPWWPPTHFVCGQHVLRLQTQTGAPMLAATECVPGFTSTIQAADLGQCPGAAGAAPHLPQAVNNVSSEWPVPPPACVWACVCQWAKGAN